jgi:hypothetical protein
MNKSRPYSLTSAQIRSGRALIRWSAEDLARASAVGLTTIRRAELTESETSMTVANDLAVRHALEAAGVEFIDENGGGPGVRLRKPSR